MALTLAQLRDNLDGLGYYFSPRGLYGLGDRNNACDNTILGDIDPHTLCIQDFSMEAYTQAAIYQFQVDNQVVATGQTGPDLQEHLERAVRIFQNNLNIFLKSIGNPTQLPVSGYYGPQTLETTKIYQRHKRLPPTGIATQAVRKILDDDARRILGKPPVTPPPVTPPPVTPPDLRSQLANLKQLHQQRVLTDSSFIDAVYKLIP
jgi:peptidoglycan hydrolase-like protein with peptidoglycan-binding domain